MVSDVTNKLLLEIEDWQHRPLSRIYPVLFSDAVHFSIRDNDVWPEWNEKSCKHRIFSNRISTLCLSSPDTLKYVADKEKKKFATDLKTIYQAPSETVAHERMLEITKKWNTSYPSHMKN